MLGKIRKEIESALALRPGQRGKPGDFVVIEYPKERESIKYPDYTVKIVTNTNNSVIVSIDGNWQCCRFAEGCWWYDWSNYSRGWHKIEARLIDNNGSIIKKSPLRKCFCRV